MNRILILSASAGAGHVRAAQALEQAFRTSDNIADVRHADSLLYTSIPFRNVYSKGYIEMANTSPAILGLLYDYADVPWKDEQRRLTIDRLNALALIRLINKYKPDMVVCTHFLPAEIISYLICQKRIDTKLAVVVTDMDIHAMWLCHHYSNYYVALDETRAHMQSLGFAGDRIVASGIPVDPVFQERKDKTAMRIKYGLDPSQHTIYMSSGGFGVGRAEEMLAELSKVKHPVQVLAMCGKNRDMYQRVASLRYDLPADTNLSIVPVGFTTDVDEYMAASDMVLGKPGGLTTSEALCRGLVFVVVNPIPGQEERNSDHLLEKGAAIRCNNLPTLAYKVDSLLDCKERFLEMKNNVMELARPHAATNIANALLAESMEPKTVTDSNHICRKSIVRRVRTEVPAAVRRIADRLATM